MEVVEVSPTMADDLLRALLPTEHLRFGWAVTATAARPGEALNGLDHQTTVVRTVKAFAQGIPGRAPGLGIAVYAA